MSCPGFGCCRGISDTHQSHFGSPAVVYVQFRSHEEIKVRHNLLHRQRWTASRDDKVARSCLIGRKQTQGILLASIPRSMVDEAHGLLGRRDFGRK